MRISFTLHQIKLQRYLLRLKTNFKFQFFIIKMILFKTASVYSTPKIGVIKENELIYYESNKQSLEEFVKHERYLTFAEITSKLNH